jgi:hypothetical protein
MNSEFQNTLNKYCIINRRYELNRRNELIDEINFFDSFPYIEFEYLKTAWDNSLLEISSKEIIFNSYHLITRKGKIEISKKLKQFNYNSSDLFTYLNSSLQQMDLTPEGEIIERKLRNILARRYQKLIKSEIKILCNQQKLKDYKINNLKNKIISFIGFSFVPTILILFFFGSRIRDGFTTVDVLTERIYNREIYEFDGSICRDGSISRSQGRGSCSWHNGVSREFFKGEHKKSRKECENEAKVRSWIE